MNVPVRRAETDEDARVAGALLHDFLGEFATPTPGAAALAERLRKLLGRDDIVILLAGATGKPLGLAILVTRPTSFFDDARAAMLEELYVVPDRRDQGIGSALIERSVAEARARGVRFYEIGVDEGDVDTRRFYEHHGFTNQARPDTDERMLYLERELD